MAIETKVGVYLCSGCEIGDCLNMDELAKVDPVAYIRFEYVYKDFANIEDFTRFIGRLQKD